MSWQLAHFLIHLRKDPRFTIILRGGFNGVPLARNRLTQYFLASPCDRLWFFDQDVNPSDRTLELLDVDGDIVAGTYPRVFDWGLTTEFNWICGGKDGKQMYLPEDGVVDAGYVAMGCTVIRRHVFNDKMKLGDIKASGVTLPVFWDEVRDVDGRLKQTEDVHFCKRAVENGFSVKCHAGVRLGHMKYTDLKIFKQKSQLLEPAVV